MWVADPAFPTDQRIIDAFNYAISKGCTHYFPAPGFDEFVLPKAISKFYKSSRGVNVGAESGVKITHGAQEALSFAIHTALSPGDEIVVPEPTYSALIEKLPIFGVKPVFVPLVEKDDWHLNLSRIRSSITEKTRMIFLCNPNNPTGTVYTKEEIRSIADILRENEKISVLSDECYSRILYDNTTFTSLLDDESIRNQVYVVNSFSKCYAMTGWRLGYIVSSKERIDRIKAHAFEYNGGVSYAVQYAGAVALGQCSSFVDSMVSELDRRRKVMLRCLSEIRDIGFETPQGGFEVFPNFSSYSINSLELGSRLEQQRMVKTIPGVRFGPSGEGHLRLVFCAEDSDRISEGMARLKNFIESVKKG